MHYMGYSKQALKGALKALKTIKDIQSPQGSIISTKEESGPQGTDLRPTVAASTAISKI